MEKTLHTTDATAAIIIGCDHAAFPLKEKIKTFLEKNGFAVTDAGTHSEASMDYPDVGLDVAAQVSDGRYPRGILLCGTGLGMSMVANRFKNVRAALCTETFSAAMSRRHNDANLLVLAGRLTGETLALAIVDVWLKTPFDGGRHRARLDKFDRLGETPAVLTAR